MNSLNVMKCQISNSNPDVHRHIYIYNSHETERELCLMELRALFGQDIMDDAGQVIQSGIRLDPDRSPFITLRLDVMFSGSSVLDISEQVSALTLHGSTFKVTCVKAGDPFTYEQQREFERIVGSRIRGKAKMKSPDISIGLISLDGQWLLGICHEPKRDWRRHKDKPQNYSTGLSVPVARALINIAAPKLEGVTAIDPCCGMGNVLIEGLSMGLDIRGCDINPLAVRGARVNLKHFGYSDIVKLADMNRYEGSYDTAVLDMPYNLCSVLTDEDQLSMLTSLRRLARRAVIVSTQNAEKAITTAGFIIKDECKLFKGSFVRNIWLCERDS